MNAAAQTQMTIDEQIRDMSKEKEAAKNVASMRRVIREYNLDTIKDAEHIDEMKGIIALSFLNGGSIKEFLKYIDLMKNKFNQTSYLNMGADQLFNRGQNRKEAEQIAKKTVDLFQSYKDDTLARPADFQVADWDRFMRMAAYPYYHTYATILHACGKNQAALYYQELAMQGQELDKLDPASIELYTVLLVSSGQEMKAYNLLVKMAAMGGSTPEMNSLLRKLCIKSGKTMAQADMLMDSLKRNADRGYLSETAKKMITGKPAPEIDLYDLHGNHVTLSQFKGKIVVLDFWATWCAPCKASMPAMQVLTRRYTDVVFIFIATQETGSNVVARVKSYIQQQGFDFRVLIDKCSVTDPDVFLTAAAYRLNGIPAKIVIDRQGNERFLTTGFVSQPDLIHEMEAMIAIAKAQ